MWHRLLIPLVAVALVFGIYFTVVEDMGVVWRAPQGVTL